MKYDEPSFYEISLSETFWSANEYRGRKCGKLKQRIPLFNPPTPAPTLFRYYKNESNNKNVYFDEINKTELK